MNIRTLWVSTEQMPTEGYRPICEMYNRGAYCLERVTHHVTLRVRYDCCEDERCACGVYVGMNLCRAHARRYGPIKDEVQGERGAA